MTEDHYLMIILTTFTIWAVRFSPAGNWEELRWWTFGTARDL